MKIFIDTANIAQIRDAADMGIIDGVTTNPTLVARENKPFLELIKEICETVDGPISVEAVSQHCDEIVKEAKQLAKINKNVVVKVPLVKEGLKAVRILNKDKILTNVTLCFSVPQALLAAKAGATYVSPFIGRLDDIGHVGMDLIRDIRKVYDNYGIRTQIIVASIRNPLHVIEAAKAGADCATIPYDVLMNLMKHPLTDIGVERFLNDWKKVPKPHGRGR
ncbi:MAG: fructose-6-phosphate aldolase [Omnitrophica WOR_2 bacterium RIFCSPLOWO2_12_FULL_51_24]|nr:MAG: fructose-6-phosphate aldolase [Omnitrophica WOR_2 bacterium RIFCSPLOWO2_02_FULL_50_19]OGX41774.1 MAG: fructose-6-phosphate aldolase [Omnitrophica WOR_2 bacterium RIFCSPLOWO2_12_FULL_51_24]